MCGIMGQKCNLPKYNVRKQRYTTAYAPFFNTKMTTTSKLSPVTLCVYKNFHYDDIIMRVMASQIISLMIVYSTVYSGADQRKHQSSTSLAFVRGIHRSFPAQMASNAENISIWWRHHMCDVFNNSFLASCKICDRSLDNNWALKQNGGRRASRCNILSLWYSIENLLHLYKSCSHSLRPGFSHYYFYTNEVDFW